MAPALTNDRQQPRSAFRTKLGDFAVFIRPVTHHDLWARSRRSCTPRRQLIRHRGGGRRTARLSYLCFSKQPSWARCSRPASKAPAHSGTHRGAVAEGVAIDHALARPPVVALTVGISFISNSATARDPAVTTVVARCCGHPVGGVRWSSASQGAPPPSSGTWSSGAPNGVCWLARRPSVGSRTPQGSGGHAP